MSTIGHNDTIQRVKVVGRVWESWEPEYANINDDILNVDFTTELDNDYWVLTKDTCNLRCSNINNTHQPNNPWGKYSNSELLNKNFRIWVSYSLSDFTTLFKGKSFAINNQEKQKVSNIKIATSREITEVITEDVIYYDKMPFELIEYLIVDVLGENLTIFKDLTVWEEENDEKDRKIKYTSFYEKNIFKELNKICEYARGFLTYDSQLNRFNYYTQKHIESLIRISPSWIIQRDKITDYSFDFRTDNVINYYKWTYNSYKMESNFSAFFLEIELESWETYNLKQRLGEGEIYWNIEGQLLEATTGEDWSWDHIEITSPDSIEIDIENSPNWLNWTIINNYSEKLYLSLEFLADTVKIPYQSEKTFKSQDSIDEIWLKVNEISNNYFQSPSYLDYWLEEEVKLATKWYIYNEDPFNEIQIDTILQPQYKIMDLVSFTNNLWEEFTWLIRRINYRFDLGQGFRSTFTLFRVFKL